MNSNYILPAGNGAWDLTSFPFGGDFIRPSTDLIVTTPVPMEEKPGWFKALCEYPGRKGTRTIASNRFIQSQDSR